MPERKETVINSDESANYETAAEAGETASAMLSIRRPATVLEVPPQGKIGKFTVSLLDENASVPSLEVIEKFNKSGSAETRTPLMTVVSAIVAERGGSMPLEELAAEIGKYWNRSLPTSPYSLIEFVYVLVKGSDDLRIR